MCFSSSSASRWGPKFFRSSIEELFHHVTYLFVGGPPLLLGRDCLPSLLPSPRAASCSDPIVGWAVEEPQGHISRLGVFRSSFVELFHHLTYLFGEGPPLFLWRDWLTSQLPPPRALIRSASIAEWAFDEPPGYIA